MVKVDLKNRVGEKWFTNEGYLVEITECFSIKNCTIKFECGLIMKNVQHYNITKGAVKNPKHISVFGVGYIGVGSYTGRDRSYTVWTSMMRRGYSKVYHKKFPTYKDCSVDERWHNFQVFTKWFEENYIEDYHLDKDILVKGNKVYSPETCCFVPREINYLIVKSDGSRGEYPIGVTKYKNVFRARLRINGEEIPLGYFKTPEKAFQAYKKAKEKEIKDMARICKSILQPKVYQALINYKVEIND